MNLQASNPPSLIALGETGILFTDLSGYTQLVYQCAHDEERLARLGLAMYRLFNDAAAEHPNVVVEGFAGDGFLALAHGAKPARAIYDFALTVQGRFDNDVRSLMQNLGFRANVSLRTGMHVGKVWRMPMRGLGIDNDAPESSESTAGVNISDAIVVASRVVTGQTCRRFGMALTRNCYKRLMMAGGKDIREPDEVIQDRNQYPEPVDVYRLTEDEHDQIAKKK